MVQARRFMLSVRCSLPTKRVIAKLSKKMSRETGVRFSQADVVEVSLYELARRRGIPC